MFLRYQNLILKDSVRLYNNLAETGGVRGRLLVELEIWPRGRLTYDFEALGEFDLSQLLKNHDFIGQKASPLRGHFFDINEPNPRGQRHGEGPSVAMYGDAAKATFGDTSDEVHAFEFYLPNTRFQCQRANQQLIRTETKIQATGRTLSEFGGGFYFEVPLDETWSISLEISEEARTWLDAKSRSWGTRLTTKGNLFQHNFSFQKPESFAHLKTKTIDRALEDLRTLSSLLSFANGGHLGPFYIQGRSYQNDENLAPVYNINAFVLNYKTTPLERLRNTWLTWDSDLPGYVKQLPIFRRMMDQPEWKKAFGQIQRLYIQILANDTLDVRFSTLGSALERIAYAILVVDQNDEKLKQDHRLLFDPGQKSQAKKTWGKATKITAKRLQLLLERIGLNEKRGFNDIRQVETFTFLRNDSVHLEFTDVSSDEVAKSFRLALQ